MLPARTTSRRPPGTPLICSAMPSARPPPAVSPLDAPGEDSQPPPARYPADLLCDAIGQAAAVRVPADLGSNRRVLLRFGVQTDTRPIHRATIVSSGQPLD